jgi:hypothetical protein
VSSRACPGCPTFVGEHDAPDVVGEASFEAAHRFVMRLSGGDLLVVVGAPAAAAHPDLGQRGDVQGQVQLPVTAAGPAMAGAVSTGHLDRRDTGIAGEGRGGRRPGRR